MIFLLIFSDSGACLSFDAWLRFKQWIKPDLQALAWPRYLIILQIVVMYLGSVVEYGKAEDIYYHPRHPYSQALLSAVPLPNPEKKRKNRIVLEGDVPSPLAKPSGCGFRTRCPIAKPACVEEALPTFEEHAKDHWVACPVVKEIV